MRYWNKVNNQLEEILSRHKGIRQMFRGGSLSHVDLLALSDIHLALQAISKHEYLHSTHSIRRFLDWVDVLTENEIGVGPVLEVIEQGRAFFELDRCYRKRKGWAKSLMLQALYLHPMCEEKGTYVSDLVTPAFDVPILACASILPMPGTNFQL